MKKKPFTDQILKLENLDQIIDELVNDLRVKVFNTLHRMGGVVGISGGIDSSVTYALALKAFGSDRVLGVMLPEKDSSTESLILAQKLADKIGGQAIIENITDALIGIGCYERRDNAVNKVFPEYNPDRHKMKISINDSGLYSNIPPVFTLTIIDQKGDEQSKRLPANEFKQIVAASNFKQRCRMSMLYYHAERLHYAVIGTPNKHEVNQGFFVKYGDGGADIMPIAHLYKSQVYQLSEYLRIPKEIIKRIPTTDTYTAEQTQEEFFYQLPLEKLDLLWYAFENEYSAEEIGPVMKMKNEEIEGVFTNFNRKRKYAEYLSMSPIKYDHLYSYNKKES